MGYDNECVVNIQSLPGEYFCPVCRTLIYPNEALQSQCTHLYCKACLAYVVATTHACPYDGYLVTEADSKPLAESNKELAENIGKVAVHCLYNRSGCQWQGTLSESIAHCAACSYGNSAVVCNRCGTQIIHRQVQEHAQICPGVQPQGQVMENTPAQAAVAPTQAASQDPSSVASAAAATTASATATAAPAAAVTTVPAASAPASTLVAGTAAPGQAQVQGAAIVYPQAAAQASTTEQWYQQQQQLQYQQYYQQYPGYDPYQQQYQQYAQYQQQVYPQYMQPQAQAAPQYVIPGQQQPQPYMQQPQPQPLPGQPQAQAQTQPQAQPLPQPQLQAQPQPQLQAQPQPQLQPQLQPQPHLHVPAQAPQMQTQQPLGPPQQAHPHVQPQTHPPPHGHPAGQPYPQPQSHAATLRPPHLPVPPQHQQPVLPQQLPHPQSYPQQQPRPQHPPPHPPQQHQQPPVQMQPQHQPHPQPQPVSQMQPPQAPVHPVSGYQSYPQPIPGPPQQRPVHMQPQPQGLPPQQQFPPQQPSQMRPPHPQMHMPLQQQPGMSSAHGPQGNLNPGLQQAQHPVHQPGQQVYQQPGMQPHGQHGFLQPQAQGSLHPGHPQQHAPVPPQQQVHPQQSLRPQGPAYIQQPTPGQAYPQGLPPHHTQTRPVMANQGVPQQSIPRSSGTGSQPIQPCISQQSPSQNYMGRANSRGPTASDSKFQLPHSGSQGGLAPVSPATSKPGASTPEKMGQLSTSDDGLTVKKPEVDRSGESISEHTGDYKSNGDEVEGAAEVKEECAPTENSKPPEQENVDGPLANQAKVEEGVTKSVDVSESSHGLNKAGEKEIQSQEGKPEEKSGALIKGEGSHSTSELQTQTWPDKSVQRGPPNLERMNQGFASDNQIAGTTVNNMHHQQMQGPGALDRGNLPQPPAHQTAFRAQGRGYPQPNYNERNPSQFPQQHPVSDERQVMPPGAPQGQQHIPHGHPSHMPDPAMISQRPPAPDRMFPHPMHQSSQERRFPEPSSHQMHAQGQPMPLNQMRPPGHNLHEPFLPPGPMTGGQEPFWPPPHAAAPGPGLPSVPGGGPSHHGFPPKGFEQQTMVPQGQAPGHLPPPHSGAMRTGLGDPLARPNMGGPPPGPLDTPSGVMGRHPFVPDDKMAKPPAMNAMEADAHKRPGFYDGRQLEPHRAIPTEHAPYGEPDARKMNGRSANMPAGRMHDSAFARGFPEDGFRPQMEDRFKHFPEEGFKAAHDEHFGPSALDSARLHVNRREFEEDLKQFPRPSHLDGEAPPRFDSYSSRPLDRIPLQPGGANALTSRPPSSYQSGGPFPPPVGSSEIRMDMGDRDRTVASHEHLGRRHEGTFPHPDHLNLVTEFGRHPGDGLPPLRSPGHFGRDIPDGLPGQLRRGLDGGLGPLGHNVPNNLRGGEGSQNMPGFFRGGGFDGFRSHLDISEPGGPGSLPPHLRIGDPAFNGRFGLTSREGDIDSFDQSRKRKGGGMVRCLICKVDCETVEGLELHSQTREHQKIAMDMVLTIKKENAKKHRTSENVTPFEDGNKSRKANLGKHMSRQ